MLAARPIAALLAVGRWLSSQDYAFTTVTPATHARVLARDGGRVAGSARDIFGWSLPFQPKLLPPAILTAMHDADAMEPVGALLRSRLRCSTAEGSLFFHSAYPTLSPESVFFGPDTYRFVRFLRAALSSRARPPRRLVDVGCGSGAGGLLAARFAGGDPRIVLADINPQALQLARVNAQLAGRNVDCVHSDVLASIDGDIDLVVANPPYLADPAGRAYRDGGGQLGEGLSVRIVREAMSRLAPGGTLLLYTATAVVDGRDRLRAALEPLLEAARATFTYEEIDPDVFGEELETPAYAEVERIAAVGLAATLPGDGR